MRETWLSENQRLVSQVLLSEIVWVAKMVPMTNYRMQFLQGEHFLPCASYFAASMHVYIYLLYLVTLYVYVLLLHLGFPSLNLPACDEETTFHSQDFLYLNILGSSVKLAQELILLIDIRYDDISLAPA